jgi:hypothetical protein
MARTEAPAAPAGPAERELLGEIAWYRRQMFRPGAAPATRAAYGPLLERRLRLLGALRAGRAGAWRDHPPSPLAG